MMFPLAASAPDILLELVFVLTGVVLFVFAALTLFDSKHPHPVASGGFWLILGIIFTFGGRISHGATGILVLIMVVLDGTGRVKPSAAPPAAPSPVSQSILGNRIFFPVLTIPIVTILFAFAFRILHLDPNKGALIGLGFGGLAAIVVALILTRASPGQLMNDGRRLNECMGAVNILPQLLASLGVIFTAAGVGKLIADGATHIVPQHSLFLLIVVNCLGMTLFTMVMGNSFAAFPVITAGVLIPLIVKPFGVDPAMAAIITLTAGSSGTLITPMAANFNIVPAALLEMKSPYGVMKFQLPFALIIWPMHVLVMWVLFRLL